MVDYFPNYPTDYQEPIGYRNGDQVNASIDMGLAGSVLWELANARRNILAIPCNVSGVITLSGVAFENMFRIPMPRVSKNHEIKVAVRYKTSSAAAGNEVYFNTEEQLTLSTTYAWQVFTIPAFSVGDTFSFSWRSVVGGSNTLTVACVCAYQVEYPAFPAWTDLSGATCKVGVVDFPYSALMLKRLCENVQHVRWRSMPKRIICCHWFRAYKKSGAAYGADEDDLGHYYFVKPAGVSTVYVDLCFDAEAAVKFTVKTAVSDSVEAAQESADLEDDASGDALWFSHTYTFAGADITDELICSLKIDGKVTAGAGYGFIPGVCVRPAFIAAAPGGAPFSVSDFAPGKDIAAGSMDYLRDAIRLLRERLCLTQLVADWRCNDEPADNYGIQTPTAAAYDKGDHGATASTVARAIMFAGIGATRLKVSVGFRMAETSTTGTVEMIYELGDSMTEATNDDTGPLASGEWSADGGEYAGAQGSAVIRDLKADLNIADVADTEIPAGALTRAGTVPHQIWVQSKRSGDSYLEPRWVIIQEDIVRHGDLNFL